MASIWDSPLSEITKEKQPMVIEVSSATTIQRTLEILRDYKVLALPVYETVDGERKYERIVSIWDILCFIVLSDDVGTARFTRTVDFNATIQSVVPITKESRELVKLRASDPISKALEPFCTGWHRVLVESEGSHFMVTQSDVIKYVAAHADKFPLIKETFSAHPEVGTYPVVTVPQWKSAREAYRMMYDSNLRSLGVVDEKTGRLLCSLTPSDLKGMTPESFANDLPLGALEFKGRVHTSVKLPETCTPECTFLQACNQMLKRKSHRVFIVDSAMRPTGVVTMSDILSLCK
mmetsp:Transcript_25629/g.64325  ORF Transcript_25629/g.64325 Transcript_25629/m.64325 type:complete len:292 (-) Transcript_25629:131-1006(-)|eukprot:CAMPEP_0177686456 /NCGR_PEP_ID=MMETSP0447-20121125/33577_1 /TAXON_ID=0 /ORGANISM="Stygamoeba regulata, Strain BSH-02190019" /LENGTH=291 /DNA_ID=CAMNT_0019196577 /DNA_START=282 /DNA_END=1157 /DNA_ORIENTATION=-